MMNRRKTALAIAFGLAVALASVILIWRPQPHANRFENDGHGDGIGTVPYPDTGYSPITARPATQAVSPPRRLQPLQPVRSATRDWRSLTSAESLALRLRSQRKDAFPLPRGYLSDYLDPRATNTHRLAQDAIAPDEDLLLPEQNSNPQAPSTESIPEAVPDVSLPPVPRGAPPQPINPRKIPRPAEVKPTPPMPTPVDPSPSDMPLPEELPPPSELKTNQGGVMPIPSDDERKTLPTPDVSAAPDRDQGVSGVPVPPSLPGPIEGLPNRNFNPHASVPPASTANLKPGEDPHAAVFAKNCYPSAKECRVCHEQIYDEWASSSHAYAAVSPMFHKFEQTINTLVQGTLGYFCLRCHAPVATALGVERHVPIYASIPAATEGVTCVACHRVKQSYGKVNGERRVEPGPLWDPMVGTGDGAGLKEVLSNKEKYKVKTDPSQTGPGQEIHGSVIQFEQMAWSHFCASCHQVAVHPGISLEVVWAQYRASPAHAQGISCQECHMGRDPGQANGYDTAPVAIVNQIPISPERKHSNHIFYGPGYSIAHPGIFPHHPKGDRWKMPEWLQFDYRAGWGTAEFEEQLEQGTITATFPEIWKEVEDREDAREIVDQNLMKLASKKALRRAVMENSSRLEGPKIAHEPKRGHTLRFHYDVRNLNSGHNFPTGSLGAQPQLWLDVALTGPRGQRLWESGYVDANGDMADLHSLEVAAGRIPRDLQLFNLQTKFLITHVKGTDREIYLPINVDVDQLPFIRPSGFPVTVMNHPPQIRMEAHSIPPLGVRTATYHVPGALLSEPGVYRLSARMRSRAEPIYFMRFCNSTPEMERTMNEWMLDFHEQSFEFTVR